VQKDNNVKTQKKTCWLVESFKEVTEWVFCCKRGIYEREWAPPCGSICPFILPLLCLFCFWVLGSCKRN